MEMFGASAKDLLTKWKLLWCEFGLHDAKRGRQLAPNAEDILSVGAVVRQAPTMPGSRCVGIHHERNNEKSFALSPDAIGILSEGRT